MTFVPCSWMTAFGVSSALSIVALARRSLTPAGTASAFGVGLLSVRLGAIPGSALTAFFFSSTFVTKLGRSRKRQLEGADYDPKGNRRAAQVLCNGAPVVLVAAAQLASAAGLAPAGLPALALGPAVTAAAAQFAAAAGDTWSSEVGVLSKTAPRLILGCRTVPPGTNGGVSLRGFLGAAAGGLLVGAACELAARMSGAAGPRVPGLAELPGGWAILCVGSAMAGSVVDSALGQICQFSGQMPDGRIVSDPAAAGVKRICGRPWLSNDGVNLLSLSLVTAAVWAAAI